MQELQGIEREIKLLISWIQADKELQDADFDSYLHKAFQILRTVEQKRIKNNTKNS